jgi:aminoglycoside phosphotransferase (APT) family kinase protein
MQDALMEDVQDLDLPRLTNWLERNVASSVSPLRYSKFPGGQSNPTYRLDAADRSYVLRRKPFGTLLPSAHAVEREYRLISVLHPLGFPVAKPYALCEDPAVIGSAFYVMEMVEGETYWNGTLPEFEPERRRSVYFQVIDRLAELHNIDPVAHGLGNFGRPGNYFERQVSRWTKQYRMAQTQKIEAVEWLIDWLPRTLPKQERTSIIHGDYRIDNLIFDPRTCQARAILDWELATLGDPLADVSYLLLSWITPPNGRAAIEGRTGPETGIPTMVEMIERYCSMTDRTDIPDLNWHFAFGQFRLIGILQGVCKRFLDGNASSANAEQAFARIPALAEQALENARRSGV